MKINSKLTLSRGASNTPPKDPPCGFLNVRTISIHILVAPLSRIPEKKRLQKKAVGLAAASATVNNDKTPGGTPLLRRRRPV